MLAGSDATESFKMAFPQEPQNSREEFWVLTILAKKWKQKYFTNLDFPENNRRFPETQIPTEIGLFLWSVREVVT